MARMTLPRLAPRAAVLVLAAALASGCARETGGERAEAPPVAAETSPITAEQMARPSSSAGLVSAFDAICAEPARRSVARQAARRDFEPVPLAALRGQMPSAAFPEGTAAWRGPAEIGGPLLLWDPDTATCELRARGVDPVVVGAEFAKLPQALEESGASVMRLQAPASPAGAARTRQMFLVSPGGGSDPERARVLRLGDDAAAGRDAVVLTARGVAAPRSAAAR